MYQAETKSVEEDEEDLRNLLENYFRRSEELEEREGEVLKQIEAMQAAVASLREWNQSRKDSGASSEPARPRVTEIEEETKRIQEETKRIEGEIRQKVEENRKLEEEIGRWRQESDKSSQIVETRGVSPEPEVAVDFVNKLKQTERKLVAESHLKSADSRKKQKNLREKMEMLEWEAEMNKYLIESLKKNERKMM